MRKLLWHGDGWQDYQSWEEDRKIRRRINELITAIDRDPSAGLGQPELLRGNLSGWASRRITPEHRLVYRVRGDVIEILSARHHYPR